MFEWERDPWSRHERTCQNKSVHRKGYLQSDCSRGSVALLWFNRTTSFAKHLTLNNSILIAARACELERVINNYLWAEHELYLEQDGFRLGEANSRLPAANNICNYDQRLSSLNHLHAATCNLAILERDLQVACFPTSIQPFWS